MTNRYDDLLSGDAKFTADVEAAGVLHLAYVRSAFAHARLASVDVADAARGDGVVAVLRAADLPMLPVWEIELIPQAFAQPPLADGVVRYVGERVVAVVAESSSAAIDAAEHVVVDYDPLPAVLDVQAAVADGTPRLFADRTDNVCLHWPSDGSAAGVAAGGEAVSVSLVHVMPRVCNAPLEGHAALAVPDGERLTMYVSTQVPTAARRQIARTLGMRESDLRVVVPHVGGAFGGKAGGAVMDHMVVGAAARLLGRPVRYVEDRRSNLMEMQGRGVRTAVTLRAARDGVLGGIAADILCDAGAYPSIGAVEPGKTRMIACGPYHLPQPDITARAVVTNRAPVGAYRGPGRSEAAVMLERTLDVLAADLGIDPVEIRRRNLLRSDELPYRTPTGLEYDSGDYLALLDRLVEVAGYDELRDEQRRRREAGGPLLGIGVSTVIDSSAWFSRSEAASVSVVPDGTLVVRAGSASAGQQHASAYRIVVRSVLPVPPEDIVVVEGDTAAWDRSEGSAGSRTAQLAGTAILRSTERVVDRLRGLAALALEADVVDIVVLDGGRFAVRGVPAKSCSVRELVAVQHDEGAQRDEAAQHDPIEVSCRFDQADATHPSAAHLSVVEVDRETGAVRPIRHVAITDCGRIIDPPSARSQVVGAIAQAIAQALYEEAVYDEDGSPLTTSFAEYGIPSACELPTIEVHFLETPSPRNPLGAKGVGEIGMVAGPVAVQNAVVDAIRHLGVRHLDMPCTPARVWNALRNVS